MKTISLNKDFLFLVAGALVLSFSPVFVKVAAVGPAIAGFYRVLIGGIILLILSAIKREVLWNGWPSFRLVALGGVLFALDLTLWHRSIDYVGPGLATILGNFQVFFLALFGVLFIGEKINWKFLLLQPTLAFNWDILFFDRPTDALDFLGAALALGAIYLGTRGRRR